MKVEVTIKNSKTTIVVDLDTSTEENVNLISSHLTCALDHLRFEVKGLIASPGNEDSTCKISSEFKFGFPVDSPNLAKSVRFRAFKNELPPELYASLRKFDGHLQNMGPVESAGSITTEGFFTDDERSKLRAYVDRRRTEGLYDQTAAEARKLIAEYCLELIKMRVAYEVEKAALTRRFEEQSILP